MEQHKEDIIQSVIAILLCIVFLWVGKVFIWNQTEPETEPDAIPASETEPNITELQPDITVPDETDTVPDPAVSTTTTDAPEFTDEPLFTDSSVLSADASFTSAGSVSSVTTLITTGSTFTGSSGTSGSSAMTSSSAASSVTQTSTTASTTSTTTTAATTTKAAAPAGFGAAPEGYFNDALFIGDSRMVGVVSYTKFDNAAYFATVGLSTYNIDKSKSEIKENKGQTLTQILAARKFGKVYINMGINEIGMDLNKTITNYQNLIQRLQTASPGCLIYLEANLRVTADKSKSDKVINNTKINKLNEALRNLCNGSDIVYLDVNPVFDDGNGALDKKYTGDNVHPKATYYKQWAEWIKNNVKL